ncbi:hypothetical protein [Bacillus toyonensis]|uniref:hypothetical protein n=1 Tax=Bacillus toyonensis TaxID=155322 RepID=UPI0015D4A829|nr:hypothetical protein [Bacillus toyonensis]
MKKNKQKDLPKMHRVVLSILPAGRSNAITTKEIMARAGIKDKRRVSAIISELVEVYKQPIATAATGPFKGVFIVQDIIDYQIGKQTLVSREKHIKKRDSSYTEGCLEIFKGMVTLDEPKRKQSNRDAESMGSSVQ